MSEELKPCPNCGSNNSEVVVKFVGGDIGYKCNDCGELFILLTLFKKITESPEVLAEKLVFNVPFVTVGGKGFDRWYSTIEPFDEDIYYYTKAEAIAATVEKLKEVEK